jgi:geranylgeranyl transferase type-2 subunit alpha
MAELKLIHDALFDPYDQSLWFYHENLMCTFDPDKASLSMAPNLSNGQRLQYIAAEREYIEEVLEDAQDCKWPYLALIECAMLEGRLKGKIDEDDKTMIVERLQKLKALDPLRRGRWHDMEKQLNSSST